MDKKTDLKPFRKIDWGEFCFTFMEFAVFFVVAITNDLSLWEYIGIALIWIMLDYSICGLFRRVRKIENKNKCD